MKKISKLLLFFSMILIICCSQNTIQKQDNKNISDFDELDGMEDLWKKYSPQTDKKIEKMRRKIDKEITKLNDEHWAGHYYLGGGTGVNIYLDISPKSGFVLEWQGCMGRYDRNYGKVKVENGIIYLEFEIWNMKQGFQGFDSQYLPVKWGEKRYLIPSEDIIGFCNNINHGREPRTGCWGSFFLNEEDYDKKVQGLPDIPEKYKPYILKKPINAKIVKVGKTFKKNLDSDLRYVLVTLNVGLVEGVLEGLEFQINEPGFYKNAKVTNALVHTCNAEIMLWEGDPLPQIGWKLNALSERREEKLLDVKELLEEEENKIGKIKK